MDFGRVGALGTALSSGGPVPSDTKKVTKIFELSMQVSPLWFWGSFEFCFVFKRTQQNILSCISMIFLLLLNTFKTTRAVFLYFFFVKYTEISGWWMSLCN